MAKENYIDINALPKTLLKEENKRLIKLMLEGDFDARQKLIESNMRLVTYRVSTKFGIVNYDKEELVSIGNLGLIKAVDTFDSKREISLATYAIKCIDNEINMFLRKLKKVQADISLSQPVSISSKDKERHIEDFLSDGLDIEEEYLNAETILRVRELVKKLPPALRETVKIKEGQNITIDLNGKTISIENDSAVVTAIENDGTLKIINTSENIGKINATSQTKSAYTIINNGTGKLDIKAGEIEAISNSTSVVLESYAIYNKESGEITLGIDDGIVSTTSPEIKAISKTSIGIKLTGIGGKLNY